MIDKEEQIRTARARLSCLVFILPRVITHLSKLETLNTHPCGRMLLIQVCLPVHFRSVRLLSMSDLRGSA